MKVNPKHVLYCAAAQIVLSTVGFILYKRPYLWAWEALEYHSEVHCGSMLDTANARYEGYEYKHRAKLSHQLHRYRTNCQEEYLQTFNEQFYKKCMTNTKSAFVSIPIVSSFLIVGIVLCLHWAPFHKSTLKKPGFMLAFLLSLILVAVNIGQIITIMVPLFNENASPDHNFGKSDHRPRMKCGYGAEVTALILVLMTSFLSSLIAFFIIRLYIMRLNGQEDNLKKGKLQMETLEEYERNKELKKAAKKDKKKSHKSHYASTLSSVQDDSGSDSETRGIPIPPMAGAHIDQQTKKPKLNRQDSGWGHSTPQRKY